MQDQRLVTRLQNYWELIRRGKPMPEIQQLNPATIDDMWQQCIKFGTFHTQGGYSYNYLFMGEQLIKMYGRDLTSQMVNVHVSEYPLNIMIKKLDGIMLEKTFMIDENQFVNGRGKLVKYRACFMPFGNEAKGITHIVVGYSGREF